MLAFVTGFQSMTSNDLDEDDALIMRYVDGEVAAFEAIVDRHEHAVLRYCTHMLGRSRRDLAADVAQDVFLRVIERAHTYEARGAFVAWLMTIARHRCLDALRRPTRLIAQPPEAPGDPNDSPEAPLRLTQLQRRLDEAVQNKLSPRQREVFALHRAGLPYAEIAAALGITPGAVKYHIFETRERLRPALAEFLEA